MTLLRVSGHDPSLRNWGFALGTYDTVTREVAISAISLCITKPAPKKAKVRVNSSDIAAAKLLGAAAHKITIGCNVNFIEVPVGSQTARAMASYGICVGVIGTLKAAGKPFVEVTPHELKLATVGRKTASKTEIIDLMRERHPDLVWPNLNKGDDKSASFAQANHMADAIGTIYAGILSDEFAALTEMLKTQ